MVFYNFDAVDKGELVLGVGFMAVVVPLDMDLLGAIHNVKFVLRS